MATVDWTDPCARADALRAAYYELVAGGETMVRVKNGDHEQEVRYSAANMTTLQRELRIAEAECATKTGGATGRRFAITAGSRRA